MKRRKSWLWLTTAKMGWLLLVLLPLIMGVQSTHAQPNDPCAAGQHQYNETRRTAPTAYTDGEAAFVCELCGQHYTEILYATSHKWGSWEVLKKPTCTASGERRRTCTRAQVHDEYETIPALSHDYQAKVTTPPVCEAEGVKTFTCTHCGDAYTEKMDALQHEYEEVIAGEPTCLQPGVKSYVCKHDPAHAYEELVPALGHTFSDWYVETPAKEGQAGVQVRVCSADGFKERRELEALPVKDNKLPVLDIVLVGANFGVLALFAVLLVPYFLCLLFIKKRRKDLERRDALRKEVEDKYGFE